MDLGYIGRVSNQVLSDIEKHMKRPLTEDEHRIARIACAKGLFKGESYVVGFVDSKNSERAMTIIMR